MQLERPTRRLGLGRLFPSKRMSVPRKVSSVRLNLISRLSGFRMTDNAEFKESIEKEEKFVNILVNSEFPISC